MSTRPHRMAGRTFVVAVVAACACLGLLTPGAAASGPSVRISPAVGPPTTKIRILGQGFGSVETVDLAFDGSILSTALTNQGGGFTGRLKVPASALPGTRTITATGESSGLTASSGYLVRTDWSRFKFDNANSGVNPYENVLGASNVADLVLQWKTNVNSFVYDAVVVGGVVYGTGPVLGHLQGRVFALDGSTGALIWSNTVTNGPAGAPTVVDGTVYIGSFDHAVHAYNASDGKPLWTFAAVGTPGTPVVWKGTVYVAVNTGYADAIDAKTGALVWSSPLGYSNVGGLALANGVLYLGTNDFKVHALDASTGTSIWTATTNGSVYSAPAISKGVVYVGSNDFNLYAFDAATGAELWSAPTGAAVTASPAVANGVVYVGSTDHNMYAFDATTGAELWSTPTGDAIVTQSPAVANGVVYNGSNDNSIYAFDMGTGQVLWSYQTGQSIGAGAAVADGVLYAPSFDGYLYTFHLP